MKLHRGQELFNAILRTFDVAPLEDEMEEIIRAVEKDNGIEREYPEQPFKPNTMKKIEHTRSFLLTETTYSDGSTEVKQSGTITDMEVMAVLRRKERRGKE